VSPRADLAADLAARRDRRVDVRVGDARAHRVDDLRELPGGELLRGVGARARWPRDRAADGARAARTVGRARGPGWSSCRKARRRSGRSRFSARSGCGPSARPPAGRRRRA
jgi:hypothetical protein